MARALVSAARPRQWVKNVLVLAVPAAAKDLGHPHVLRNTVIAFVAFCLASSGTYLLNDAADVESDRLHPSKRFRPLAARHVSIRTAQLAAVVAIAAACGVSVIASVELFGVVAGYVLLPFVYSRHFKHVPVFDVALVASGFFLRAVAGGVASHLFVSRWFLIIAGAGSLFLVSGKRYAELNLEHDPEHATRPVLTQYTAEYLRGLLSTTAGVTVIAYCLWAFEGSANQHPSGWTAVSAIPFVLGIMRYGLLLEQGHGEEPEQVVMGDRTLLAIAASWVALFAFSVLR